MPFILALIPMPPRLLTLLAVTLMLPSLSAQPSGPSSPALQRTLNVETPGFAASVRVPDQPLVFTSQVGAADVSRPAAQQAEAALAALAEVLAKADSSLADVVRLNAYVTEDAAVAPVEALVAARFAGHAPAFTLVRSPLPTPGAQVVFDAVATTRRAPTQTDVLGSQAAILPAGAKLFISGQAERGTDLGSAVRLTMAGLHRSLAHLGLKKSDVVQLKAFITPFGDHAAAVREIAASFDGGPVPPVIWLEWVSDLYTEIELIASARALNPPPPEPVNYLAFPWLTKSPRFSHACTVSAGTPLIFLSGIDGGDRNDPRMQMKTIFERLGSALFEAGTSYRSMVKATYYLNDRTARAMLGDIRAVYFDPNRPPSASALGVNGLGRPGRAAMVDMIAVPIR